MGEWRETTLGDVVTFQRGFDIRQIDQNPGLIPVISSSGITSYHNEYKAEGPGVLVGRKGTLGTVFYVENNYWPHSTSLWVKDFHGNNPRFIYYFLKTFDFKMHDVGSSNPTLNRNHVHLLRCTIPSHPEQCAIAEVLSSLDDKIDLLMRQNATLEALVQTYFQQWFVEGASEDWDKGKAEDYYDIAIGKTPPRNESQWFTHNPSDYVWVSIADMGKSGLYISDSSEYLTVEAIDKFNIRVIPKGTVLLSFKLTVGRVAIAQCEMTTNEAIAHFKYKNDYEVEYLYCYLKSFDYYSLGSTSSIATAVNSKIIKAMPYIMPKKEIMKKFHVLTNPLFSKIEANTKQIQTLQKLRDTLLPKLISGEVRVNQ